MNGHPKGHSLILIALLLSSISLVPGCLQPEETVNHLSFQFALPEGWQVINADSTGQVTRLDTDGDGEPEWIVLYSFDVPPDVTFTPVRCAIYRTARREPKLPILYPYHLQAPNWTYLGEGSDRVYVRVDDVVTNFEPDSTYPIGTYFAQNEVIVENSDGNERITRVSIFQWRDTVVPAEFRKRIDPKEHIVIPSEPPGLSSQWYQCMGLFQGSVEVVVERDQVTVRDRVNDRSQLARVLVYKPDAGIDGYLHNKTELVDPRSSCIDFAFGLPADVTASPYPEKIVMAFHDQFRSQAGNFGDQFLSAHAREKRNSDQKWSLFKPLRQPAIQSVCMKMLRFGNEMEAEVRAYETPAVIQSEGQVPAPIKTQVETWAEYHILGQPTTQTRVVWDLVKEGDVWKIDDILQTD